MTERSDINPVLEHTEPPETCAACEELAAARWQNSMDFEEWLVSLPEDKWQQAIAALEQKPKTQ